MCKCMGSIGFGVEINHMLRKRIFLCMLVLNLVVWVLAIMTCASVMQRSDFVKAMPFSWKGKFHDDVTDSDVTIYTGTSLVVMEYEDDKTVSMSWTEACAGINITKAHSGEQDRMARSKCTDCKEASNGYVFAVVSGAILQGFQVSQVYQRMNYHEDSNCRKGTAVIGGFFGALLALDPLITYHATCIDALNDYFPMVDPLQTGPAMTFLWVFVIFKTVDALVHLAIATPRGRRTDDMVGYC